MSSSTEMAVRPGRTVARIMMVVTSLAVLCGATLVSTPTAGAVTSQCKDGRCVIYLSKQETRDFGQGRAPKLPPGLPWQISVSYTALVVGHQFFARQYADRGWCSAFLLSPRPWDNQGYIGYKC